VNVSLHRADAQPAATGGEIAYRTLRARILEGELAQETLLREQSLAEEMGLSRTPIREALRRLAEGGLVELIPNKGARVLSYSEDQILENLLVRSALEGRAARLAAFNIDREQLAVLDELVARMDVVAPDDDPRAVGEMSELNREFHHRIVQASDSRMLINMVDSITPVTLVMQNYSRGADYRKRSNAHHRDIVTAIRSRDEIWAEICMRSHFLAARNAVLPPSDLQDD
jgi:DNA-binding GntR family transcriptional regulator